MYHLSPAQTLTKMPPKVRLFFISHHLDHLSASLLIFAHIIEIYVSNRETVVNKVADLIHFSN